MDRSIKVWIKRERIKTKGGRRLLHSVLYCVCERSCFSVCLGLKLCEWEYWAWHPAGYLSTPCISFHQLLLLHLICQVLIQVLFLSLYTSSLQLHAEPWKHFTGEARFHSKSPLNTAPPTHSVTPAAAHLKPWQSHTLQASRANCACRGLSVHVQNATMWQRWWQTEGGTIRKDTADRVPESRVRWWKTIRKCSEPKLAIVALVAHVSLCLSTMTQWFCCLFAAIVCDGGRAQPWQL